MASNVRVHFFTLVRIFKIRNFIKIQYRLLKEGNILSFRLVLFNIPVICLKRFQVKCKYSVCLLIYSEYAGENRKATLLNRTIQEWKKVIFLRTFNIIWTAFTIKLYSVVFLLPKEKNLEIARETWQLSIVL